MSQWPTGHRTLARALRNDGDLQGALRSFQACLVRCGMCVSKALHAASMWRLRSIGGCIRATVLQDLINGASANAEVRDEVREEHADTERLLQHQWAARIGLPQLQIQQAVGEGAPFLQYSRFLCHTQLCWHIWL